MSIRAIWQNSVGWQNRSCLWFDCCLICFESRCCVVDFYNQGTGWLSLFWTLVPKRTITSVIQVRNFGRPAYKMLFNRILCLKFSFNVGVLAMIITGLTIFAFTAPHPVFRAGHCVCSWKLRLKLVCCLLDPLILTSKEHWISVGDGNRNQNWWVI